MIKYLIMDKNINLVKDFRNEFKYKLLVLKIFTKYYFDINFMYRCSYKKNSRFKVYSLIIQIKINFHSKLL